MNEQTKEVDESTKIVIKYLSVFPKDLQPGEQRIIDCPTCKTKTLTAGRAKRNGHAYMHCDKCKFDIMA